MSDKSENIDIRDMYPTQLVFESGTVSILKSKDGSQYSINWGDGNSLSLEEFPEFGLCYLILEQKIYFRHRGSLFYITPRGDLYINNGRDYLPTDILILLGREESGSALPNEEALPLRDYGPYQSFSEVLKIDIYKGPDGSDAYTLEQLISQLNSAGRNREAAIYQGWIDARGKINGLNIPFDEKGNNYLKTILDNTFVRVSLEVLEFQKMVNSSGSNINDPEWFTNFLIWISNRGDLQEN